MVGILLVAGILLAAKDAPEEGLTTRAAPAKWEPRSQDTAP
ncbi:hypothetical protein [Candidatus Frankia alpina]|nr:hypothetical protein [Candidatus Frankia alpina]